MSLHNTLSGTSDSAAGADQNSRPLCLWPLVIPPERFWQGNYRPVMPAKQGREYIVPSRASCVIGSVASELMGYGQGVIIGPHTCEA